jgi:hypothetical protein
MQERNAFGIDQLFWREPVEEGSARVGVIVWAAAGGSAVLPAVLSAPPKVYARIIASLEQNERIPALDLTGKLVTSGLPEDVM